MPKGLTINEPQYAGFWLRFGATIIDSVIFGLILMVPLALIYGESYWIDETMVHGVWDVLLSYVVPFIATLWFWRRFLGTPGKMLLRLRVVDARTGEPLPLGQCVLRFMVGSSQGTDGVNTDITDVLLHSGLSVVSIVTPAR